MKEPARQGELRELPDGELLQVVRDDPRSDAARQAASELLERYQNRVYAWCCHHLGDPDRARDVAQEALLRAYRGLPRYEGRGSFSAWLFTIARNRCMSELARPGLLCDPEVEPDSLVSQRDDPAEAFQGQQGEEALKRVIGRHLSRQEQQVLWLRCYERMPVDSITALLDIRQASGARGVLQAARRKLRAALARRDEAGAEVSP